MASLSIVNGTPLGNHWANLYLMIVCNKNAGIHVELG